MPVGPDTPFQKWDIEVVGNHIVWKVNDELIFDIKDDGTIGKVDNVDVNIPQSAVLRDGGTLALYGEDCYGEVDIVRFGPI